jgi:hypothetical protein
MFGIPGPTGTGGAPTPQQVIDEINQEAKDQFEKSKALHRKQMATWQ